MQRFLRTLTLSGIFFSFALVAQAQAVIVPPPGMFAPQVSVDYHRVSTVIDNQIATTTVEMQFTNVGEGLAEGQFLFPLPQESAVEDLTMTVNGVEIESQLLRAAEARAIYDQIVRDLRDPALLEYVGRDLLQANVFPIPAGESRQIRIQYGQLLTLDNGLVKYVYPLKAPVSLMPTVGQLSVRVSIKDAQTIGNVYSPSQRIAISRQADGQVITGFEQSGVAADSDFVLYYGLQSDGIGANLLSYRESANEDGFFMMMLQPPALESNATIQPKDVVIVLDQSGSMEGTKWTQAQDATIYILEHLNANDRFNVIPFSTGYRNYASELMPASDAVNAVSWVRSLYPEGGTNISDALTAALSYADAERPLSILFMTDGLATEGIVYTADLLAALQQDAPANARMFTFGVGDDVDTVLLDSLVRDFRGTGSYVRPTERVDEEVASLYTKINSPVLNDIALMFNGVTAELMYPQILPDLFAGEQVTIVGRYRNSSTDASLTLTGKQAGEIKTYTYPIAFAQNAGGEDFIARLWATRRIGDLLNAIRLQGENKELVDSIVALSIRYGIITPYTSFLITEDDILSQLGRDEAEAQMQESASALRGAVTGSGAVDAADMSAGLANASAPMSIPMTAMPLGTMTATNGTLSAEPVITDLDAENPIQYAGSKTFILQNGIWTDSTFDPDTMTATPLEFLSDAYFDFLTQHPEASEFFAVAEQVIVVIDGQAIQVVPAA